MYVYIHTMYVHVCKHTYVSMYICTINGEGFVGLNFHSFRGFQEHRESFSMNISATLK